MGNFWDFIWTAFLIFAFAVYLMILFSIITDLFRDTVLNGWYKALWILFLVWVPYITAFVYLIARGKGMAHRQHEANERRREAASAYIRDAGGVSASTEIGQAKALLDSGAITQDEYEKLKARALA
jgi:Na+-translocating ferredoxin:NAD+ oxidoreductase RnfE subunit